MHHNAFTNRFREKWGGGPPPLRPAKGTRAKRSAARRGCAKFNAATPSHNNQPDQHHPSIPLRASHASPFAKRRGGKPNLPFAPRRGRGQAKRSTQGMREIQRSNNITQRPTRPHHPCIPLRLAALNASPFAKRRGGTHLPFATRRGRVPSEAQHAGDARDSTQQPPPHNDPHAQHHPCIPLRLAALNASPFALRRGGLSPNLTEEMNNWRYHPAHALRKVPTKEICPRHAQ